MEIRVDRLKERPRQLVFTEAISDFPLLCELAAREAVVFGREVRAELTAELVGSLVEVEGALHCTVVLPCSRCLQPVEQSLDLQVALTFSRLAAVPPDAGDELELTEHEVDLIPFDGEGIDLRSALEQEVLMALPQHPLCRDDCAGLCPKCGAELNGGSCGCALPVFHGALAMLKNFKVTRD